ncbi:GCN5-related N acetyltransferase [Sarocladium implicatum]|nr:GCN5-related N acetyltransferase [Sarocladium implicatum]
MSLPTTKQGQQSSIRSFFQTKAPNYAPPPSSASTQPPSTSAAQPPPPPPPPAALQPETTSTSQAPAPYPPPPPSLHESASLRPVTEADGPPLRRINNLLLPVPYSPDFYARAADPSSNAGRYSRVISFTHKDSRDNKTNIVGGIVCRLVDDPSAPGENYNLYISSLSILSPYRGLGLVSSALDHVVATAVLDKGCDVTAVTAHVWTGHEESLGWYERRGFVRSEKPVEGYYLKLRPSSAWVVTRKITNRVSSSLPQKVTSPPPPQASANETAPPVASAIPPSTTAAVVNLPPRGAPPRNGSFQNQRPETEWNDLPADMAPGGGLLAPPKKGGSGSETGSGASSRSSSTMRKKRDRSYPAAAFGGS